MPQKEKQAAPGDDVGPAEAPVSVKPFPPFSIPLSPYFQKIIGPAVISFHWTSPRRATQPQSVTKNRARKKTPPGAI